LTPILTINGVDYDASARAGNNVLIDQWSWSYDSDWTLEFHEHSSTQQPRWYGGVATTLTVDGIVRFTGQIVRALPSLQEDDGWVHGYQCQGLKCRVNAYVPVTAVDYSGTMVFNLPPDDEDYVQANSGLSVGAIISAVLAQHATQLAAIGVVPDATTAAQLATLTVVPPEPVYISGERLWQPIEALCQRWARNIAPCIPPNGAPRFNDTTTGTTLSLTQGADPIQPVSFKRDWQHVATRVLARGTGEIWSAYLSLLARTLTPAWTAAQQALWTYADFAQPGDAYMTGPVVQILGPNLVRLKATNPAATFGTNFWSGRQANLYLFNSGGTGITFQESKPVTANTAMAAGGTSDVTVGLDLNNSATHAYDSYKLIGSYAPLGSGGNDRNNVFRLFNVTDPGGIIAQHLVKKFPVPVPFANYSRSSESLVSYPVMVIVKGLVTYQATFRILPAQGQILFDNPVVASLNSQSALNAGGSGLVLPDDVYGLLAYSRGVLSTAYPPDVAGVPKFAGEAFDKYGYRYTQTVDVDNWQYAGNQAEINEYAQMIWQSTNQTVYEGPVHYNGAYTPAFDPGTGLTIVICGNGYMTGYEGVNVTVRGCTVKCYQNGPLLYSTAMQCSSRRNPRTGDQLYVHPAALGSGRPDLNPQASFSTAGMSSWSVATPADVAGGVSSAMSGLSSSAGSAMSALSSGMMGAMSGAASGAFSSMSGLSDFASDSLSNSLNGFASQPTPTSDPSDDSKDGSDRRRRDRDEQ